jgi:23S rRNA (cytidine1920-2'-O)/16S rRNA (cytidine1409-2'-O)-methyltransferase
VSSRLDAELVRRGLARSRAQAADLVKDGRVRLGGTPVVKAATPVAHDSLLEIVGPMAPWVGRAAYKLLAAFESFGPRGLTVAGRRCLDVGASTGGFTQVLLSHGATQVTALDVGHGQLVAQLAADPRVTERSGTNIRCCTPSDLGGTFDLVVADLSFISLRLVLPVLATLTDPTGDLVTLIKPQFEVGRERLGKGGVVRCASDRLTALRGVIDTAAGEGLGLRGLVASPIRGTSGNQEYLGWFTPRAHDRAEAVDLERLVAAMESPS